jgi:hypothetical protein
MRRLLLALALLAACKSSVDDGYAIDLNVVFDSSVSDAAVAGAATLHLDVSGAESFARDIPIAGKLDGRSAGLRYKPGAQSGTLTFALTALDGSNEQIAAGTLDVTLAAGKTQVFTVTLSATSGNDGGVNDQGMPSDLSLCGNGVVDPGELCDPGAGSSVPCPRSVADCDDNNACTTEGFSGTACQAMCSHTPVMNGSGCGAGGDAGAGVCQDGACCMGCIKNGVCLAGNTDAKACGSGGNACFDCTMNSATATCNGGQCSGCDATSCTTDARTCGTSSCGFNCGSCPDSCANGALTHYACVGKTCAMNGGGNCGLYTTCASSKLCATSCVGDNGCVATAFCGAGVCKPKVGLGGVCSAETTGDHECASPYVCSWGPDGKSGYCVQTRCTGCVAAYTSGQCTAYINWGIDPRNACQGYTPTACHQNYCRGTYYQDIDPPSCDVGQDAEANWRPCGSVTCTNTAGGTGTLTGMLCSATGCAAGQTTTCSSAYRGCYACNNFGCDLTKYNQNCN